MADPVELPGKFVELLQRGIELVDRGDAESALVALNQVIDHAPTCAKAFCGRGTALRIRGYARAALADYDAALRLEPSYARAYFNRGLAYFELGEHVQAFADFDRAIAQHAEAAFFLHRGRCRFKLQDFENAINDFSTSLELDPAVTVVLLDRGIAYLHAGNTELAIQDFEASVRREPRQAACYLWLASALLKQGDTDRAVDVLSSGLKMTGDCRLHQHRAKALYDAKDFEASVGDYNHVLRVRPDDADAYYSRGCAWSELREYDEAIADLNEAIRIRPDFANAFWARGDAWLSLGEPELASADLSIAIGFAPTKAGPLVRRAEVARHLDDDAQALADLDLALRLDPHDRSALKSRCQLNSELGNWQLAEVDLETLSILQQGELAMSERKKRISMLLAEHFDPQPLSDLTITDRQFPYRVRADLQRAIDRLFGNDALIAQFCGVKKQHEYNGTTFADLLYSNPHDPAISTPPEYEELDIGEDEPIRCLKNGLWLIVDKGQKIAVFLTPAQRYQHVVGMRFNVAAPNNEQGAAWTQEFFKHLEESVLNSESYRGKILSLEVGEEYSGMSSGIRVHKLRTVERDQVVLPQSTLDLLDRNIIQFAAQRKRLAGLGLATKKGVLFYGPPGTGKTHTIHYLARAMAGHTTLLITAEQVGLLSEYMTLARLLQPSIVVIEDADLIARERTSMGSACEELLLNKLLNEMDGLRAETDVFFILTTNRPEALEAALASRPGRIDQAIEFPLPDADGRRKLVQLYSRGASLPADVVQSTVNRTEGVSASFVKELVRRAAQFYLERANATEISNEDVDNALNEMLFAGGSLNRSLLGVAKESPS